MRLMFLLYSPEGFPTRIDKMLACSLQLSVSWSKVRFFSLYFMHTVLLNEAKKVCFV